MRDSYHDAKFEAVVAALPRCLVRPWENGSANDWSFPSSCSGVAV
jgi:hypothetical protein